jgi:hypothetical protein
MLILIAIYAAVVIADELPDLIDNWNDCFTQEDY